MHCSQPRHATCFSPSRGAETISNAARRGHYGTTYTMRIKRRRAGFPADASGFLLNKSPIPAIESVKTSVAKSRSTLFVGRQSMRCGSKHWPLSNPRHQNVKRVPGERRIHPFTPTDSSRRRRGVTSVTREKKTKGSHVCEFPPPPRRQPNIYIFTKLCLRETHDELSS